MEQLWIWLEQHAIWFWLGAVVVFGVAEAVTIQLVSIWFAAGAAAALLTALAGGTLVTQWIVFLAVAVLTLVLTRPLVRRAFRVRTTPTNADRVLGTVAKVTETIDNENASGVVYVDGKTWTARSADGVVIPAGEQVRIERIEGVKLLVEQVQQAATF